MPEPIVSDAFLAAVPKSDLHVHLDGSIRIPTLIELAAAQGVELPSRSEAGLREQVFKDRYENLEDYLRGFAFTAAVLQHEEALERCAYELACDNQEEGVRYLEVRFAPQLHVREDLDAVAVLAAVDRGLARAAREFNARPAIASGPEPPFAYGIICSAMRRFTPAFGDYYAKLLHTHRFTPPKAVFPLASLELARAAVHARDEHGLPIVGFDLAGEEAGYPAGDHRDAFVHCQKNFLKKTVHAGEAYGPESIFHATAELGADRIGHGTYLLDPASIRDPSIEDREGYVEMLGDYIAHRRITLEVCLTSNLQTHPQMRHIREHPFRSMLRKRLSATLCTDNRTISHTSVTRELKLAVQHLGMSREDLKRTIIYGFKRSFFPGPYHEKRAYVRKVIDLYEALERRLLPG